ncbi:MAG TPA: hypothetical protein VKA77_15625 [Mycobacterium sp.]|jgi:hypothetical protein|nr:hypothetical protein [Mycobacterium sp.]
MTAWINLPAVSKIVLLGLLLGAGLPALFAVGVRLNAQGAGAAAHGGVVSQKNPALAALSWVLFALVLVAVVVGVLFVARDFIGQHTGLYILGAKHK